MNKPTKEEYWNPKMCITTSPDNKIEIRNDTIDEYDAWLAQQIPSVITLANYARVYSGWDIGEADCMRIAKALRILLEKELL